jgi:hypothetical protein
MAMADHPAHCGQRLGFGGGGHPARIVVRSGEQGWSLLGVMDMPDDSQCGSGQAGPTRL